MANEIRDDDWYVEQIRRARKGDLAAKNSLLLENIHILRLKAKGSVRGHARGIETTRGVVSASFANASERFGDFRGNSRKEFQTWLRWIVHNVERQYRKKDGRKEFSVQRKLNRMKANTGHIDRPWRGCFGAFQP